jgi:hypothetical protein
MPDIINQDSYSCPLLNRDICMGECTDIQMVRWRFLKPNTVAEFDREQANRLCDVCPYNQMSEAVSSERKAV